MPTQQVVAIAWGYYNPKLATPEDYFKYSENNTLKPDVTHSVTKKGDGNYEIAINKQIVDHTFAINASVALNGDDNKAKYEIAVYNAKYDSTNKKLVFNVLIGDPQRDEAFFYQVTCVTTIITP